MDRRYESERQDIIAKRRCKKILSGKTLIFWFPFQFKRDFDRVFFLEKIARRINYFWTEFVITTRIVKSCLTIKTCYYYELNCMLKTNNATSTKIIEFKKRLKTNYSPINLRNSFPKCITTSCTVRVYQTMFTILTFYSWWLCCGSVADFVEIVRQFTGSFKLIDEISKGNHNL